MDVFPGFSLYVIHQDSAVDRVPLIQRLEQDLGQPITIFKAHEKKDLPDWPGGLLKGHVGCTDSHVRLLEAENYFIPIGVFEDDAEVIAPIDDIVKWINEAPSDWDILLLGTNVNESIIHNHITFSRDGGHHRYVQVSRWYGTHALIIKQNAALKILKTHARCMLEGNPLHADWLYSRATVEHGLVVFAPEKNFVRQKPGLTSTITGAPRD